ncbi:MAG: 2OG-Fe(II) oxygenase [Bacteroidota bacterium]
MSFIIKNQTNKDLGNWYYFANGFSNEEIDEINRIAGLSEYEKAKLVSGSGDYDEYRKSEVKWLNPELGDVSWIYNKFANMCTEANNALWQFEITGMFEDLQYALYRDYGGHYDWHMDVGPNEAQVRKISIVLQLSEPEEYEGGVFELFVKKDVQQIKKKKGSVILFPSYCMHRVTPVTKGERRSMVLWVSGPPFK